MKTSLKRGFTLVELLVVVLIIGVLSSVALPQYTKAVNKSKVAGYWPTLKNLAEAARLCHLEKGNWCNLNELDIEAPSCKPISGASNCEYYVSQSSDVADTFAEVYFYGLEGSRLTLSVMPSGRFCEEHTSGLCAKYGMTGPVVSSYGGTSRYALDSTSR